ncbi:MAG: hypothetical protein R3F60_30565 [bacterium]
MPTALKPIPTALLGRLADVVATHFDYHQQRAILLPVNHAGQQRLPVASVGSPIDQVLRDVEHLASRLPIISEAPMLLTFIDRLIAHAAHDPRARDELTSIRTALHGAGSIVATLNPERPTDWQDAHPGAAHVEIDSPPGGWGSLSLPGTDPWHRAIAGIDAFITGQASLQAPLLVYASPSVATAAWLGNRLMNLGAGRAITFFQLQHDPKVWRPWGPHGVPAPSHRETTPTGLDALRPDTPAVALIIDVIHRYIPEQVDHGLATAGVPDAPRVVLRAPDRIIPDAPTAAQRAFDLAAALEAIYGAAPRADVHLFYIGPVVPLMLAATRFHKLNPLVVHERGPGLLFRPALRIGGGGARILGD